ncbi:MAG: Dimethylsulfonioproprionate demethylase DmdA [Alphaproteobacteria bacterium MarineAlpha5_Bin9]|nr:MAG: Dimethylsulfonioproprionate demethylase DmdA [Alphaproteobacteria bacterium MarineAlpha5_Bin9]|tara:strand:+ start:3787 stop:5130 length:1344 start_codon:yes stop_codon:yes gene_type:complete
MKEKIMIKHYTSVDQSDRRVPYNLRQSGPTPVQMLISTRVRKSPYWHLSMKAGCWRATVYNRVYHPRGYVKPEDGGAMVEYEAIMNHVTMWNVAVERQIMVKGPDAEAFVDYVITRDAKKISPMRARYVILCNSMGGVLNDPILLRISKDEFWFSLSDSDIGLYLQGVNHDNKFNVVIDEIDVCPVQIQGPKAHALMKDLVGNQVDIDSIPFYGLAAVTVGGKDCIISQTGFSGAAGFEIYLRDATLHADDMWNAVLDAGKKHNLMVIAPAHHRRIQAGILSWGQDMDNQHNPFQCNLGYQVSLSGKGEWKKSTDYVGKQVLEKMKEDLKQGKKPYKLQLVGMVLGGKPIEEYAPDFWLISPENGGDPCGYITSPWYHPEQKRNIAMGYVPFDGTLNSNGFPIGNFGKKFKVHLPDQYSNSPGVPEDCEICPVPFTESFNPNTREVS